MVVHVPLTELGCGFMVLNSQKLVMGVIHHQMSWSGNVLCVRRSGDVQNSICQACPVQCLPESPVTYCLVKGSEVLSAVDVVDMSMSFLSNGGMREMSLLSTLESGAQLRFSEVREVEEEV